MKLYEIRRRQTETKGRPKRKKRKESERGEKNTQKRGSGGR